MHRFRVGSAAGSDWRAVCRRCVAALGDLPPEATLGFVYASDPLTEALDLIAAELRQATGIVDWVGAGAAGVCTTGREHLGEGALVVLVAALPPDSYHLFDDLHAGEQGLGPRTAAWLERRGAGLGIVHADRRHAQSAERITRLARERGVFLVGGLTSAEPSAAQIAGGPTEGGLSGVLLAPEVAVITALTQGCVPIGPAHEVSGARGHWVLTLDRRPALEVLKEEIGELLARQLDRIGGFIHAALPVAGSDRADYLVRNLLGVDRQAGALAVGSALRRGDALRFVKRDGTSAQQDLSRMLDDLLARTGGRPVRGALYHTCLARGVHMFGPDSAELRMIEAALGPVPLAGFFADGEIFHDRLYAYTGVLTLFL